MASIVKTFREEVPAMRFIGKKYEGFGPWWGEWFANGWFDEIEKAMGGTDSILKIWENGGGYVGLERRAVEQLYRDIGVHFRSLSPWQVYIITSDQDFEFYYGKRADKKRKLYNGMIPCSLYQFFKNDKK